MNNIRSIEAENEKNFLQNNNEDNRNTMTHWPDNTQDYTH